MGEYKPLKGLKVIELGNMVAMAACGRMYADLGADVIKVENLTIGDKMRVWPVQMGLPGEADYKPIFDALNAGKRSISIDTRNPEGSSAMDRLLGSADIFITNVREGALKKSGIDYESLHAKFPKLIMAQLNGYGEKGAEATRPGYDTSSFWARGGFLYSQAIIGGNPVYIPMGMGDVACGMGLAAATLMALHAVRNGHDGDCVSTSLYGMAAWLECIPVTGAQFTEGTIQFPMTREGGSPYGIPYKCADGLWFLPQVVQAKHYPTYYKVLGLDDLVDDPTYANRASVMGAGLGPSLIKRCAEAFEKKTQDEWFDIFQKADLPAERLSTYKAVLSDKQARVNDFVFDYEYPNGEKVSMVRSVAKTLKSGIPEFTPGPKLGQDTVDVLKEIGYSKEQIDSMLENGIAKQQS